MIPIPWAEALSNPAALRALGLFAVEGRQVLQHVLDGAAGGPSAIVSVLATAAAARVLEIESRLGDRVTVRTPAEMEALTGFNFHRGVLALVRRPPQARVSDLIALALSAGPGGPSRFSIQDSERRMSPSPRRPVLVAAEHLVDVDNVGSCFRNARAFGAAGVLLDERSPDPLYRKSVRTSLGTVLEVPWVQAPFLEILERLAEAGVATIGLTPDGGAAELFDVADRLAGTGAVAMVVGNEGQGLSSAARARCAHLARIPMADGADSLNVATALAVALYEWRARRR